MALFTSTDDVTGITPEQYASLVINPLTDASVALQVASVINTDSTVTNIPVVQVDAGASFVAEGAEISPTDATIGEINVAPAKLAGLTIVSNELADDSDPSAQAIVGDSLARSVARTLDNAFFGSLASPAPAGLGALAGVNAVAAGTAWTDLDPFLEARSEAEANGAQVTAWVANPATALALAQLKEDSTSNRPLLQADVTNPTVRRIDGVPLYVSAGVAAGVVWGIPKAHTFVVLRKNVTIEASREALFTSDQTAVKVTLRAGFGFAHPGAVQKISIGA